MSNSFPAVENIHTIGFDFDGVFTDNKVYVREDGKEMVRCDRADGLGFDILRAICLKKKYELDYFILSKEKNAVVEARAKKLRIKCYSGVGNKLHFMEKYFAKHRPGDLNPFLGFIYLGNDLNDLLIINRASFSVVPNDAHDMVKSVASMVLPQNGGDGFLRAFIEKFLNVDKLTEKEINEFIFDG